MTTNQEVIEREGKVCAKNYLPIPVTLVRGEGVWLWDVEGKKYLDMMSAYSAVSYGHSNPRILNVLNEQAKTLAVCSRAYHTDKLAPLLEKLCFLTGLDQGIPMNTGAEAVETAIKGARRWGHLKKAIPENEAEIIICQGNFHGRTTTVISFSSEPKYRKGFGPFTPGFRHIPFGDAEALEKAITPNTCAFLVEPMQGEAGIIVPPKGWLLRVREICTRHNVLLILDEVQTGLGRTGKMFAFGHENVKPDGLTLGKALGGGVYPVSVFLGTHDLMSVFTPGSHGSTFGGNPLACAVALESLKILEEDNLVQKSERMGAYLKDALQNIKHPWIKDIRGAGLWIGIEMNPAYIMARDVCLRLVAEGILSKETHDTVIRFAPPLTITEQELEWGLSRIRRVFENLEEPLTQRA